MIVASSGTCRTAFANEVGMCALVVCSTFLLAMISGKPSSTACTLVHTIWQCVVTSAILVQISGASQSSLHCEIVTCVFKIWLNTFCVTFSS
jgi:hypothetical protein